jgi:hypothetical protein
MTVLIVLTSLLCVIAAVGAFLAPRQMFYWMARSNAHLREMLEAKKEAIMLKSDLGLAQAELWRRATELSRTESLLRRAEAALHRAAQEHLLALDDKTKSLVRLAVSNTEEHEQHAAAMLACRRLMERMDP